MGSVRAEVDVPGLASEAEALWYEPARWASWVDGFGHVAQLDESWPHAGARLVWDSRPGGRGRVVERVLAHEARAGQTLEVEDPRLRGTQTVSFAPLEGGVRVALGLEYELKQGGPGRGLLDALFVRRQLRDSLRRTLSRFAVELESELSTLR